MNRVLAYSMLDPYIGVLRLRPGHRVPGSGTLNPKPGKGFGLRGFRVYGLELRCSLKHEYRNASILL